MSLTVDALIVLTSIFASAFFSGAETALTAASRARMHALEMDGDASAKLVNRLIAMRSRLISAMLLGGQIVNIAASSFATSVLLVVAGDRGVVYATVIMTVLVVIFAEVLPKTIAIAYPDRVSLLIAPVVSFFVMIFWPVVATVETFVRSLLWLCGVRPAPGTMNCAAPSISCIARAASTVRSATCSALCSNLARSKSPT
jgi:magnesium and cobalt exporter, CNNM family